MISCGFSSHSCTTFISQPSILYFHKNGLKTLLYSTARIRTPILKKLAGVQFLVDRFKSLESLKKTVFVVKAWERTIWEKYVVYFNEDQNFDELDFEIIYTDLVLVLIPSAASSSELKQWLFHLEKLKVVSSYLYPNSFYPCTFQFKVSISYGFENIYIEKIQWIYSIYDRVIGSKI